MTDLQEFYRAEERLTQAVERINDSYLEAIGSMERLEDENAKLRKLVGQWYPHMLKRAGKDALAQWGQLGVLRELGIEAEDA